MTIHDHTTTLNKTCWGTKQKSLCFPVKMAKMETISKRMAIFPNPLIPKIISGSRRITRWFYKTKQHSIGEKDRAYFFCLGEMVV